MVEFMTFNFSMQVGSVRRLSPLILKYDCERPIVLGVASPHLTGGCRSPPVHSKASPVLQPINTYCSLGRTSIVVSCMHIRYVIYMLQSIGWTYRRYQYLTTNASPRLIC